MPSISALDAARRTYRFDELSQVVERWWCIAVASSVPGHDEAIERGLRLLAGEDIATVPVDSEALRR